MSLFEGSAPDPVTLTASTKQEAPPYLTSYLQSLAAAGEGLLGGGALPAGNVFQDLRSQGGLEAYKDATGQALTAGKSAMDVGATDISKFYDLHQQEVIDEMQRQSDINVQRNVIPALRALGMSGAGGAAGTKRGYDISGQALADIASNLQSQQTGARSAGFKQALDAALREQGQQASTASALSSLGGVESTAATQRLKTLADIAALEMEYEKNKIEAPVTRAVNVSNLLRGYQFPTTTSETKQQLPTVMSSSPLSQISGLASLIGAAFPSSGKGIGNKIFDSLKGMALDGQLNINLSDLDRIYNEAVQSGDTPVDSEELNTWLEGLISGTSP